MIEESNFRVDFPVNKEMLDKFVNLTKDSSSLHTDAKFARRSMYRENVIHGMLPVSFISIFPSLLNLKNYYFEKITARFLKPIFIGENLSIVFKVIYSNIESKIYEVEYVIENSNTHTAFTSGSFVIKKHSTKFFKNSNNNLEKYSMLDLDIIEKDLNFKQIEKGTKDEFPFSIDTHTSNFFIDIINEGLKNSRVILNNDNDILNLMSVCLFSTFVGICIPGRKATFVDFIAFFEKNIILNRNYLLRGEVSFKSKSTNILLENLQIIDVENDTVNALGKLKVKVNEPPVTMPSSADLFDVLNLELKGKVALITGASGGIGETTAKVLALYGVKVIVNYLNGKDEAYRIVEDIRINGGEAFPICADVSDRLQVKKMVSAIIEQYGTVDILVNNAVRKNLSEAFTDITWEEFQKDIDVNLKGTFNCCQEVIPYMVKAGAGKIINMGTIMTDDPTFLSNDVKQVKYVASKNAVVGLTRALAIELAPLNIQVNIVCPHLIDTDLTRNIPRMYLEKAKNETPMNRLATPLDVSKAIVFLASSLCSFTTGQKLMVTGGNPPFL